MAGNANVTAVSDVAMTMSTTMTYVNFATKMMRKMKMTTNIDDYRKLLDLIMSEGLARIEALTDEELRKVMVDE